MKAVLAASSSNGTSYQSTSPGGCPAWIVTGPSLKAKTGCGAALAGAPLASYGSASQSTSTSPLEDDASSSGWVEPAVVAEDASAAVVSADVLAPVVLLSTNFSLMSRQPETTPLTTSNAAAILIVDRYATI